MFVKQENALTLYVPGDYACVSTRASDWKGKLANQAIKSFTHSQFTHSFLITRSDGTIVQSTPSKGVHEAHIRDYEGVPIIFSNTALTSAQRQGIVASAYSYVGKDGYGFLDIGYIALYVQGVNWTWLEHEVEEETHRTICSQLVAMCGRSNGVTSWLCGKPIPQLVFPADLANLALK